MENMQEGSKKKGIKKWKERKGGNEVRRNKMENGEEGTTIRVREREEKMLGGSGRKYLKTRTYFINPS